MKLASQLFSLLLTLNAAFARSVNMRVGGLNTSQAACAPIEILRHHIWCESSAHAKVLPILAFCLATGEAGSQGHKLASCGLAVGFCKRPKAGLEMVLRQPWRLGEDLHTGVPLPRSLDVRG